MCVGPTLALKVFAVFMYFGVGHMQSSEYNFVEVVLSTFIYVLGIKLRFSD